MEETCLSIGGLTLCLRHPALSVHDPAFDPFLSDAPADITVDYICAGNTQELDISVSGDGAAVTVYYAPAIAERFTALRGCLMNLPVEQLLSLHGRFFLHASVVTSPWGALLFSGDSGVGKSTQAQLWQQCRGSELINGDRAILQRGTPWLAHGSLYAGSSGCYCNRSVPVGAIVLLEQGRENTVTAVPPQEALSALLLQSVQPSFDKGTLDRLCDLLLALLGDVAVYRLRCTPDVRAVDALAAALEKGTPPCKTNAS